jgi:hypothetical protein
MLIPVLQDAPASTVSPASQPIACYPLPVAEVPSEGTKNLPTEADEFIRHLLFGSPKAVQVTIRLLYRLNYAEPNDWSPLLPTGRVDEVMSILTKRVRG